MLIRPYYLLIKRDFHNKLVLERYQTSRETLELKRKRLSS